MAITVDLNNVLIYIAVKIYLKYLSIAFLTVAIYFIRHAQKQKSRKINKLKALGAQENQSFHTV